MTYSQLFLNLRGKIPPENHCFRPVFELRHSLSRERAFQPTHISEELDLEGFTGLTDFLNKATFYQNYFNFVRPNSYKGDRTPWQIIQEERPDLSPEVLLIPPLMLDAEFRAPGLYKDPQVGQYLPIYPEPE